MHRPLFSLALVAALGTACAPSAAPPDTAADEAAIRTLTTGYLDAVNAGDFDRFLSYFTEDVAILPPDQPAVRGRDAFIAFARPFFDQFTMRETITFDEIRVAGDWAVGLYRYTFTVTPKAGGAANEETGKGVGLMRRDADGTWKWTHSLWNRDHAVPPMPTG